MIDWESLVLQEKNDQILHKYINFGKKQPKTLHFVHKPFK